MTEQQILQILLIFGINLAAGGLTKPVAALLVKTPSLTDAQLVSDEDGSIKHLFRTKLGFLVDLFWPEVSPYLDQGITAAIPEARVLANVPEPA